MKTSLLIAAAIIALAMPATAQTASRSFYDGQGQFAGSSTTRGPSSSFYNGSGSFAGSATRQGKWTNFYDSQGRYSGTSIGTSPRR